MSGKLSARMFLRKTVIVKIDGRERELERGDSRCSGVTVSAEYYSADQSNRCSEKDSHSLREALDQIQGWAPSTRGGTYGECYRRTWEDKRDSQPEPYKSPESWPR